MAYFTLLQVEKVEGREDIVVLRGIKSLDDKKIVFVAEHEKRFATYDIEKTIFEHRFPKVPYSKDSIKQIMPLTIICKISESHIISVKDICAVSQTEKNNTIKTQFIRPSLGNNS